MTIKLESIFRPDGLVTFVCTSFRWSKEEGKLFLFMKNVTYTFTIDEIKTIIVYEKEEKHGKEN